MLGSILRSSLGSDCSRESLNGNEAVGLQEPGDADSPGPQMAVRKHKKAVRRVPLEVALGHRVGLRAHLTEQPTWVGLQRDFLRPWALLPLGSFLHKIYKKLDSMTSLVER